MLKDNMSYFNYYMLKMNSADNILKYFFFLENKAWHLIQFFWGISFKMSSSEKKKKKEKKMSADSVFNLQRVTKKRTFARM